MDKIRVGGETIDPKKSYSGNRVIELLGISYDNGCRRANGDYSEKVAEAYDEGYKMGYKNASEDIRELKEILHKLMES